MYFQLAILIFLFGTTVARINVTPSEKNTFFQKDQVPSIDELCKSWKNDYTSFLVGMAKLGKYFYAVDEKFHLVQVPAEQFSFHYSGAGNNLSTHVSLDLTGGKVHYLPEYTNVLNGFLGLENIRFDASIFFVEGTEGHRLFPKDSLSLINLNYYLNIIELDSFNTFEETGKISPDQWDFPKNKFYRMLSTSGQQAVVYYPGKRMDFANFNIPLSGYIRGLINTTKIQNLQGDLQSVELTGGFYIKTEKKIVGFTNHREVKIFTENHLDFSIPFKDFLHCPSDSIFNGMHVLYFLGIIGVLLSALFVSYYFVCHFFYGKPKGSSIGESGGKSKSKTDKKGGKGGSSLASSTTQIKAGSSNSTGFTSDKTTASKLLSAAGTATVGKKLPIKQRFSSASGSLAKK